MRLEVRKPRLASGTKAAPARLPSTGLFAPGRLCDHELIWPNRIVGQSWVASRPIRRTKSGQVQAWGGHERSTIRTSPMISRYDTRQACLGLFALVILGSIESVRGQSQTQGRRPQGPPAGSRSDLAPSADGGETAKFRVTRVPSQEQAAQAEGAAGSRVPFSHDFADVDWTLSITNYGEVQILYHGAEVVKSQNFYWVRGSEWAGPNIRVSSRSADRIQFGGPVEKLNMGIRAAAWPLSPHALRVDMEVDADKSFSGITGGGITWMLKLDSPSFRGKAGEPRLLLDKSGWRWPVSDGQELMVRFDEPVAKLFFEQNQKN